MSSVDAVVFSAVAKVQRQIAGFYGDEIAVDYLTHPSRTAEEVDTWLEDPDNQARVARVYNSVLGFNRMGQYGYGRLIGSGTALTVLAASTAAVQALSYNTEFRTAILSHDPALINALANGPARDYLLAQHPAELAGWLASTASETLTTLLDDHMTAMQDVMANPVCAPILMGDPATKNQLINYPALIDAIAATNDGLDAVLNDTAAWQTIVESETLLAAWLESSRAVERLEESQGALEKMFSFEESSGVYINHVVQNDRQYIFDKEALANAFVTSEKPITVAAGDTKAMLFICRSSLTFSLLDQNDELFKILFDSAIFEKEVMEEVFRLEILEAFFVLGNEGSQYGGIDGNTLSTTYASLSGSNPSRTYRTDIGLRFPVDFSKVNQLVIDWEYSGRGSYGNDITISLNDDVPPLGYYNRRGGTYDIGTTILSDDEDKARSEDTYSLQSQTETKGFIISSKNFGGVSSTSYSKYTVYSLYFVS